MAWRPSCREDFEVAIICALPLEYDAVSLLFDEFWDQDGDAFGRAAGDVNTYRTGRIGRHCVVLALLSGMGKVNAAAAAASMRFSYNALKMVILSGICGGVPFPRGQAEVLLGDVVISKSVVQYDFGRKYPNGFMRKDTVEDNLSKPDKNVRNLLAMFNTNSGLDGLQKRAAHFLQRLQDKAAEKTKYEYPGVSNDRLFEPSHRHKHHHPSAACICSRCHERMDPVCGEALTSSCEDLGCDERHLVKRRRLEEQDDYCEHDAVLKPTIHIGIVASGDTVMKSGEDRDRVAEDEGVIAFEMEGAGVWEEMSCIVVKGVCDYADCHKNKEWQDFAAATAASASKAILERYIRTDKDHDLAPQFLVPFRQNKDFVGRGAILPALLERIPPATNKDDCQRTVIEGLGGVGKTQIALEALYRVHKEHPDCSIFWVPVVNAASFENAYRDIGKQLKINGIDQVGADVKMLVKNALSEVRSGSWLMVVDNADDAELLFGAAGLSAHLPFSNRGSILFTTRNHEIAARLEIPAQAIIHVAEMDGSEALGLLQKGLQEDQTSNTEAAKKLLDFLANLPLAIRQASAYMAAKQISTLEYLELCQSEHRDVIDLLSKDFEDRYRYKESQNPVATTWLVSFNHISQHDPLAAEYLEFISILAEKDIPKSLLPAEAAGKTKAMDAIGTLKAYAFITQLEGKDVFDMHRLVRLAMRNWLENKGNLRERVRSAIVQMNAKFPLPEHGNRDVWMPYLPHALAVLNIPAHSPGIVAEAQLLSNVARSNFILGRFQASQLEYRRETQICQRVLGKDHPYTLISMGNAAFALIGLGEYKEAEQIQAQMVKLFQKVLGKTHWRTIVSMDHLASTRARLGEYKGAKRMQQKALKLMEKALGKTHLDTLLIMNNLAITMGSLGEYEEAEQMHRQVLALREQMLGRHDPHTLASMDNLAGVFSARGRCEEAVQMHSEAVRIREETLSKTHPDTLHSRLYLASGLYELGRFDEAKQMHEETLALFEKTLGKDHVDTLHCRTALADVLVKLPGKDKESEQIHRQVLAQRKRMMGETHPSTLYSMRGLVVALDVQGKYDEAERLNRQLLEHHKRTFGKKHPEYMRSMASLAVVCMHQGKWDEAEVLNRRVTEMLEKLLGKDHVNTQRSRSNLARCLEAKRAAWLEACLSGLLCNMGLMKRSRRFVSEFLQAPVDSGYAAITPRANKVLLKEKLSKRASVVARTMESIRTKEKKRKREPDADGLVQRKRRLAGEEEEETLLHDDAGQPAASHLPSFPCGFPAEEGACLRENHDELITQVQRILESLSFDDDDAESPGTSTNAIYDALEPVGRYRERRCHSESSILLAPHDDAFMGEVPDGCRRRSAPPDLDVTWRSVSDSGTCIEGMSESPVDVGLEVEYESMVEVKEEAGDARESWKMELEREPVSETTFETTYQVADLSKECLGDTERGVERSVRSREVTGEDVARRIRALSERMLDRLMGIEQALRPFCSNV